MKNDSKLLKEFKKKWERVRALEEKELRNLPLEQRMHQITSLMRLGLGLRIGAHKDKEILKVRSRWLLLKKKFQ